MNLFSVTRSYSNTHPQIRVKDQASKALSPRFESSQDAENGHQKTYTPCHVEQKGLQCHTPGRRAVELSHSPLILAQLHTISCP